MKAILLAALLSSVQVYADQCAWNDRAIAARGSRLVKMLAGINGEKPSAYIKCEPCGDKTLTRVELESDDSNVSGLDIGFAQAEMNGQKQATYWQVTLNRKTDHVQKTDLAYLYVKTAKGVYANVASLVECPVSGVTPILYDKAGPQ